MTKGPKFCLKSISQEHEIAGNDLVVVEDTDGVVGVSVGCDVHVLHVVVVVSVVKVMWESWRNPQLSWKVSWGVVVVSDSKCSGFDYLCCC